MPEREVLKIAAEQLRPMNQGLITIGAATNFGDFADGVYLPVVLAKMAQSTRSRYCGIIKKYLKPQFGSLCLREITVMTVDRFLAELGKTMLSYESVDKIRDVLSSILQSAVRYELLVKNPATGLTLPRPRRGRASKPYIMPQQFAAMVEMIPRLAW